MMPELEDWEKYFLYPLCKKAVALTARLSIACLWVILLSFIIALPISHLLGQTMGAWAAATRLYILGNYVAILASLFLCAFLGLLLPWCHSVLLYQRGSFVTRALSLLGLPAGLFIIISTLWSLLGGGTLLPNQILAPFMVIFLLWLAPFFNWAKMQALSTARRVGLLLLPPLLMLELYLGLCGFYFFAAILYLPIFLLLRPLLQWLHQHARLIVELPPLPNKVKSN